MQAVLSAAPHLGVLATCAAFGVALVKPCVVGTTARASAENVRSIGYSIYYTLVNIGGFIGPLLASYVHKNLSVENVFRAAAVSVFLMFFAVLLFFKEPRHSGEIQAASLAETARNLFTVMTNPRFMAFLLIFSGYWIVYWQLFIILPIYIHGFIDAHADVELILVTGPVTVICLQFVVTYLTQKIPAFQAITLGTLISALGWLIVASHPAVWAVVLSIFVIALGEIVLSPRYYEYVSRLAPPGQQGTYMGFAFVPIGIGSLAGGWLGGRLMHHYGEVVQRPAQVWWAISAIGIGTALLMWLYHFVVKTELPVTPP